MRVAVIGAGKMGLPLACTFADRGAFVTACDVRVDLINAINRAEPPFDEPGLEDILRRNVSEGRLKGSTDTAAAIRSSEVVVVIVPVMLNNSNAADLSIIEAIAEMLSLNLSAGALVSFETTLPVGTTRRLGAIIETGGLRAGVDFDLVFSPERVKSQLVFSRLTKNPKVVGGINERSAIRGVGFYSEYLGASVLNVGSLEAAELVKLAGMVYRDVNIALANELANYSQMVGVDFQVVREAANTDGEAALLSAGIGVGGHCTPVYPHFLINDAISRHGTADLAEAARRVNLRQPHFLLNQIGIKPGSHAVVLGVSFRPQVKESAYSPVFALVSELERLGAIAYVHDPFYSDDEILDLGLRPGSIENKAIVVLNTAHSNYENLDFSRIAKSGGQIVVDGRNLWQAIRVTSAGLRYVGVGRPVQFGE